MLKEGISRLPVLRGKTIIGIITRADIINAIGSSYTGTNGADGK
jgi:CBS domain-containing protein